jgi:hypothetical protein
VTETRYLIPADADWVIWDDVNGVLSFMTDADAVANARENEALLGEELGRRLPPDPTPEQAWAYVNGIWEGDPGGRGWQARVPDGATWLSLRGYDEDDADPGAGPEAAFGFGAPPLDEGAWQRAGY